MSGENRADGGSPDGLVGGGGGSGVGGVGSTAQHIGYLSQSAGGGKSISEGSIHNPYYGYDARYSAANNGAIPGYGSSSLHAGSASGVVDGHWNAASTIFPLPRTPADLYNENQHTLADHHRFDLLHWDNDASGPIYPSLLVGARMHMAPPHYAQSPPWRSWLQPGSEHGSDVIADMLNALTIGGGVVSRGQSEFWSQGLSGDHGPASSWHRGRGLWNADPYAWMRLKDVRAQMSRGARDVQGCQFLARMVEHGGAAAARQVFDEIAGDVVRLMGHPVGHVLVEKLAVFWTDEETIARVLGALRAAAPDQILEAAKNYAGSNILQTLTDRIAGRPEQVGSFTRTLSGAGEFGVLALMQDMSGSLLILKCLDRFPAGQNQFITSVALRFSFRVCQDRHGYNVYIRCLDKPGDEHTRASLIDAVCRDGLPLAEHGAGNYVVQHVIKAAAPWAKDALHLAFRGRYVILARHKAGSHVVQRCLEFFTAQQADDIVWELLNCGRHCSFGELVGDPYANYVVQTTMKRAQGQMYQRLVHAINLYRERLQVDAFAREVFQKLDYITRRRPLYRNRR